MIRPDPNGSDDLGLMQVNTLWVPSLAARARLSEAATSDRLVNDPCFNIAAAALILRVYLNEAHGALLPAIGDYHSHTQPLNQIYVLQTEQAARRLFGD
jgi:soluble lytic murein transglycosylase-like protein